MTGEKRAEKQRLEPFALNAADTPKMKWNYVAMKVVSYINTALQDELNPHKKGGLKGVESTNSVFKEDTRKVLNCGH